MYNLQTYVISHGSHFRREDGTCLLEVVAMLAGECHTDQPKCVDPTITQLGIILNDMTVPYFGDKFVVDLPERLIGTRVDRLIIPRRVMAINWAIDHLDVKLSPLVTMADYNMLCSAHNTWVGSPMAFYSLFIRNVSIKANAQAGVKWKMSLFQDLRTLIVDLIELSEIKETVFGSTCCKLEMQHLC